MMPTRILLSPFLLVAVIPCPCKLNHRGCSLGGLSGSGYYRFVFGVNAITGMVLLVFC
jgi:hypothetical protein